MHFVNVFRDNKTDRKFGAIKDKLFEINFSNEQSVFADVFWKSVLHWE
jgi:hypothetical protein